MTNFSNYDTFFLILPIFFNCHPCFLQWCIFLSVSWPFFSCNTYFSVTNSSNWKYFLTVTHFFYVWPIFPLVNHFCKRILAIFLLVTHFSVTQFPNCDNFLTVTHFSKWLLSILLTVTHLSNYNPFSNSDPLFKLWLIFLTLTIFSNCDTFF